MSFEDLGLNKEFVTSVQAAGYEHPTELQQQLIPCINKGSSVLVWTQSASGKTGSFLIPAISYILSNPLEEHRGARVLILTSRRDRVNQITYTIKRLLGEQSIRTGFIVSGRPYQPQMRLLRRPLDLMIATPGRLNDLVDNNKASFNSLEMLIIDDLTAIYKKGLHPLIDKILAQRTNPYPIIAFVRHDDQVTPYARQMLTGAEEITIQDEKTQLLQLKQQIYLADDYTHKIALMDHLLDQRQVIPTIIYTVSAKTAKSLADSLANHGHTADAVHLLAEEERNTEACPILIVADQEGIQAEVNGGERVIHFDVPEKVEHYVSRLQEFLDEPNVTPIVMLVGRQEREQLKKIEEYLGEAFEQRTVVGLEPSNRPVNRNKTEREPRHGAQPYAKRPPRTNGSNDSRPQRPNYNQGQGANGQEERRSNQTNNRKGPYGRTNGGGQNTNPARKRTDTMRSNPASGHDAPYAIGDWENQTDYMPAKTANPDKKVVIRYKEKRRTLLK
ncbi:DEAD/DEAH box helicase [Thiofilum flexile]|uniref:DEAD/DEAH box helicase n=1 Tax=Thiofilum flexile TaxID=125627 RepID=UPI0003649108|nr:DEAD/DEAH box helicase [Thiofilum flexile]